MKKVLLIFNGINAPENVLSFIRMNLGTEGLQFHGIFINKLQTEQAYKYPFPNDLSATAVDYTTATDEAETYRLITAYIKYFENECRANNLTFKTDFFRETSLDHLIERSAYADLIISDRITEFDHYSIRDILVKAHCPVLLLATDSPKLLTAVLTYDGSINSMYAIKQYRYLLPELSSLPTTLLTVTDDEALAEKQHTLVSDWLALHFSNASLETLYGKPEPEMVNFITRSGSPLVVMGAFGRSTLSRWLNSSHAEKILSETDASVFITHLS